jgi:hypothetical protein
MVSYWREPEVDEDVPEAAILTDALADDPRRLAAVVGDAPEARAVAMAIARAGGVAWYADPDATPEVAEVIAALEARVQALPARPRPCVVLDRPVKQAELLRALVSTPLHRRLLVLVPCTRGVAARLAALAAYPRASVLVLAVERAGAGTATQETGAPGASSRSDGGADETVPVRAQRQAPPASAEPEPDSAEAYRARAEHRLALGDPAGAATALEALAEITRDRRAHEEAAAILSEALGLWVTVGDLGATGRCHLRLAQFAERRADPHDAVRHYEAALKTFREHGSDPSSLERLLDDLHAARAAAAATRPDGEAVGVAPPA